MKMEARPMQLVEGPVHISRLVDRQILQWAEVLHDQSDLIGLEPDVDSMLAARTIVRALGLPDELRTDIMKRIGASLEASTLEEATVA